MPESLSNTQLKNRLLGAGILVVGAVIVIPLFLGEPKHAVKQEPNSAESTEFESRIQPLPDNDSVQKNISNADDSDASKGGGLVLKKLSSPVDGPEQNDIQPLQMDKEIAKTEVVPEAVQKPKPVAEATPPKKTSPTKEKTSELKAGWVVQAGIFSKPENAVAIAGILKNNGYAPNVSNAKASFGNAKRVWIGPFASKSEAQKISRRLEQQTGNGGYVASYPFKS